MSQTSQIDEKTNFSNLAKAGLIASAGLGSLALSPTATIAQTAGTGTTPANVDTAVGDITATMTSLGTLAGSALVLALGVVGISMAIGYGKKIMAKG